MQKNKLDRFIQKYNLGGNAEQVKWTSKNNKLSTRFVTGDESLLGQVEMDNFLFEDCDLGVYDTTQLKSLLSVMDEEIDLSLIRFDETKVITLTIKDGSVAVNYSLSDVSVIPSPPTLKKIPVFNTKITLDEKFIEKFIKGKNALPETEKFTLVVERDGTLSVVIGYSNTTSTNRVSIAVKTTECNLADTISFNANLFKEILIANKECTSAVLEVSNEGLAKINFKIDEFNSSYYLVSTQKVSDND